MASIRQQPTDEERAARDVFTRLAAAADEFERYRHPHAERIAALCDALARLFHLGRADRASLRIAALAHDLGEAAMKRDYIRRADALNADERLDLARHPVIGEQEAARAGADRAAQLIVRWSHEWWNGGGYPDALRREQIPLAARILRVADSYCSLTDDRPFRPAGTEEEARRHLAQWAGIEFDPRVVRAFLTLHGLPELRSYARRETDADQGARSNVDTPSDAPALDPADHATTGDAANNAATSNAATTDDATGETVKHDAATDDAPTGTVAAHEDAISEDATSEAATSEAATGPVSANDDATTRGHAGGSLGRYAGGSFEGYENSSPGGRVPEAGANPYAPTSGAGTPAVSHGDEADASSNAADASPRDEGGPV